jgi:hypothetical protein
VRSHVNELFEHARQRRKGAEEVEKPFFAFVNRYAWWLRIGGLAIAVLVLVFLPTISGLTIIITAAVLLVYMALIELLR